MRSDREGHVYPSYRLRASRALAAQYLQSQGAAVDLAEVPPTYMIFLRGEVHGVDLFKDLDVPRRKALHGGQRYEWYVPIGWDHEIDVTARVLKVTEKNTKSGPLWIAEIAYEYHLAASQQLALREITRIIERS